MYTSLAVTVVAVAPGACGAAGTDLGAGDDGGISVTREETFVFRGPLRVDLVVVVDDSPAATGQALPAALADIGDMFERLGGGAVSIHVAVVPASAGSCGSSTPERGGACGLAAPVEYLRAPGCGMANFTALPDALACLADVGAAGCEGAQPIATALHAIAGAIGGVPPFLRDDADLGVIILAAGDDASPGLSIDDAATALLESKRDPKDVFVSVLVSGAEAPRLRALVDRFGNRGAFVATDAAGDVDAGAVLGPFPWRLDDLRGPCIDFAKDVDLAAGGLQADCVVAASAEDVESGTSTELPTVAACGDGDGAGGVPCWRLEQSLNCPDADAPQLIIDRGACPFSGTVRIICTAR